MLDTITDRNATLASPTIVKVLPIPIIGRRLAHGHFTASERALLAVDMMSGRRVLTEPTVLQAAWLAKAAETYVDVLRKATPSERAAVKIGCLSVATLARRRPQKPATTTPVAVDDQRLVEIARERELVEAARELGLDKWLALATAAGL